MGFFNRRERVLSLVIALLAALLPFALYGARALDDNRLVSWAAMAESIPLLVPMTGYLLIIPAAYGLAKFRLPGPYLLFLLSFLSSSFFWSMPETIVDASRYFVQAKHLALYGPGFFVTEWGREIDAWTDLPLIPFIYGLIFRYGGEVRLYAQIFNSLLFAVTVLTTVLLAREFWDREIGELAGTLLLAMPYLFTQTPLLMVDIGAMAFLTLAAAAFLLALRRGGRWLIAAALAVFLAFFAKYSLWLMLSILGLEFLLAARDGVAVALRRAGAVALLGGLLIVPVLLFHHEVIWQQLAILREFQQPGLRAWGESFTSTLLFHIHPFLTFGAAVSLLIAFIRRDYRLLVVAALVLLLILGLQVRRIRYLLPIFPLLAIMAAYGFGAIGSARVRRFGAYCAAGGSLVLALTAYLPYLNGHSIANLQAAGRFMDQIDAQGFHVQTRPQPSMVNPAVAVPLLDLYTDKAIYYDASFVTKPSAEEIAQMSLRFTWSYANPRFYTPPADVFPPALAVIWGYVKPYPPGYELAEEFSQGEKTHTFRPYVSIFLPK